VPPPGTQTHLLKQEYTTGRIAILLHLKKLRDLTLTPGRSGGASYLSAASGLVAVKSFLYVVADDELHLGMFPASGDAPGVAVRILEGELPEDRAERKRLKPDLEALMLLPPGASWQHGALLALGSGSRRNRRRGVLLRLNSFGGIEGAARTIDLSPMLDAIAGQVGELNIEGATIVGDRWVLLQRGNKGRGINALVHLNAAAAVDAIAHSARIAALPFDIRRYDLGLVDGIPLCFTDAAALPDGRLVFAAVAEDTDDAYRDGRCTGAAVGIIDANGVLQDIQPLHPAVKAEGIDAWIDAGRIRVLLVTDADDPAVPAALYQGEFPSQELHCSH